MIDKDALACGIADRVELSMKQKGLSRKDLQDILPVRGLSDWRHKSNLPPITTIVELSERLEVSLEWLVLGKERETFSEKLARDIAELPSEYRSIIEDNVEAFKRLCFKQRLGIS